MQSTMILKEPILTEKSLRLAKEGWFTFRVEKDSAKRAIAKAVEEQFGVQVIDIRTLTMSSKTRRVGKSRRKHETGDWKKAVVQLKKDQKIALFDVS